MSIVTLLIGVVEVQVFPQILVTFGRMFEFLLDKFVKTFYAHNQQGLEVEKAEIVSALERLATFTFTGDVRVTSSKIWENIGISGGITYRGWPYFNSEIMDLTTATANLQIWPVDPKTSIISLAYLKALSFHYGATTAQVHLYWCYLETAVLARKAIRNASGVYSCIENVMRNIFLPEIRQWVAEGLHRSSIELARGEIELLPEERSEKVEKRKEILKRFMENETPFKKE